METSPSIKEISAALGSFQAEGVTVKKDGINPHFKSTFATLDNMLDTIREPLAKHGLSFAQFPDGDGLTTILMHTSGEWMKSTAHLNMDKQTPQGQGSAITYLRRYSLAAALGIATEEDDDGNTASQTPQKARSATKTRDTVLESKKRIMSLLAALNEEQTAPNILFLTDLSVENEANLPAIIDRLEALTEERKQK